MTDASTAHRPRTRVPRDRDMIPRMMVRAMFGLVMTVLVLVTLARVTGYQPISTPPAGEVVTSRDLLIGGDMAGRATIHTTDGALVADLSPEEGGFISGVWRVILRERTKHGQPLDGPVTVLRRDTGRLEIHDPSTAWSADLMGFGKDNAAAFARLLSN